jgi:hypothetical protein
MMRIGLLIWAVAGLSLWASTSQASERSAAPAADCLDARLVERFHVPSAWQLAVATSNGQRYRVELAEACPAAIVEGAGLSLLAREGWVCGEGSFLRVQGVEGLCPIAALAPADEREFARLARDAGALQQLDTVEVKRRRPTGFKGSEDFCFASRRVRSWSEVEQGLVIEVTGRGAGGNTRYRVELDSTCNELGRFQDIDFRSGANNGLICGNVGDAVIILPSDRADLARQAPSRMSLQCTIREVYPLTAAAVDAP